MTGNSVADFMLGLPRRSSRRRTRSRGMSAAGATASSSTTLAAARDLTLSLGLRYELNTPVQTYAGLATMLAEDFETIIPSELPSKGFEFHEPNKKDFAPRLGATYRLGEKTVLRAGYGIYYNPNQMNSFTFLTNNPPLAAASTSRRTRRIRRCRSRSRPAVRSAGRRAGRDFADPQSAECAQGPVELRYSARDSRGISLDLQYVGSHTSISIAASSTTPRSPVRERRPAPASQTFAAAASFEQSHRRLRRGEHHPAEADASRPAGRCTLHLVEDARHVHALQRRRPDDEQLRHPGRIRAAQLGRPAPVRRQLHLRRAVLKNSSTRS